MFRRSDTIKSALFRVTGIRPIPEPRGHPFVRKNGKPGIRPGQDAGKAIDPWKLSVRRAAVRASGKIGETDWPIFRAPLPVVVSWAFWLPRPASHFRAGVFRHLLKPTAPQYPTAASQDDLDNLIKAAKDALGDWQRRAAIAWSDDAQVVGYGDAWKYYADDDNPVGVEIMLEHAPDIGFGRYDSRKASP